MDAKGTFGLWVIYLNAIIISRAALLILLYMFFLILGCTMIQMLTGEPPWKNRVENVVQLHMLLMRWEGPPPYTIHARYFLFIISLF